MNQTILLPILLGAGAATAIIGLFAAPPPPPAIRMPEPTVCYVDFQVSPLETHLMKGRLTRPPEIYQATTATTTPTAHRKP